MIPRFSNPHFLLQSTKLIARAELGAEDEGNPKDCLKGDSKTIEYLHRLLDNSLPTWNVSDTRSRIEGNDQVEEEPVLFRLISSTLPALPVSLLPPSPPPSITREPEAEDNELQADRRRKRAEAAAVNGEDILPKIRSTQAPCFQEILILRAMASIPVPEPRLMIVQRRQSPRKTRPPVRSSELLYHPYVFGAPSPLSTSNAKCPSVEAQFSVPGSSPRRGRRRRKALGAIERPPAQYYRPNPKWEGKCRGYGYGYASCYST